MATYVQKPVGPAMRGENAMARALSRNANPGTTTGPGMLAADRASNTGAIPGPGAPTVSQKPNPSSRGNNLNNNMLTGKSTGLASRASTQRENPSHYKQHYKKFKQTNGVKYNMNINQMAQTENYKKRRAYTANLTDDNSLFAKYTGTTDYAFDLDNGDIKYRSVNAFIAQNCSNNGLSKDNNNQSSVHTDGASMVGDDTADVRSYKSQLSNKRNKHARKLIVDEKDREATIECWEDGVVYAERLIIAKTSYFINFAKVHPVSFTERFGKIKEVPIWSGIMMFANIYSKPRAHYPSNLLAMFGGNVTRTRETLYGKVITDEQNNTVHIKGIACLIQERIPQVDKYRFTCYKMTYNLFDLSRTIINTTSKLASMLGVKPEKTIEAYKAKVEAVVSWNYNPDKLNDAKDLLINLISLYGIDYKEDGNLHSVAGPIMASIQKLFSTTPLNEAKAEDTMKVTAELVKANDK